ncbi:DNA recombination protein RmuC [Aliarcobacter cibarius]|uniref:DNA recombination protein n=1 Tax=Aliarcobacter cibarius TaxID=255507 RepID=A0A5J6RI72_9BACT|nr:DNA recombination protein RmuC [Aliarcobacter cibarius]QEZ89077.1 DNA recombination protein [Aliarcobacter cibarius]QKJ27096.1 DNA recombination protein [Aliarcobacter cibarius]TLS96900.1 DNA recombination protein RmuC [Aliarcobacter cibarius]TLS97520.1 DNA recombination protein RmuC [Aliarcobacter cibarius]TLT02625.1 DNA recombination protein RmuC [Aliarcobacter cibarius]
MILEFESTNFYLIVAIIFIVFVAILFFVTEKYKSKIKTLELEKEFLETSLAQNRENQNILKMEIENITSKIFEENSKKSNQNINQILEPFKSQLNIFGNRVNEVFTEETKQRVSLLTEIKNLKELNNQISNDANNLANALKGQSKIQGDWGEMILESILKQSGLRKDLEYKVQNSYKNSEGQTLRPDVIVHLPTNKDVIIDSKLSLNSYIDYFNSKDEGEKKEHINRLIFSIKNHIKDLSSKKYESLESLRTLDFVLMFVPIEGAFSLLMSQNNTIFETALKSNIVIVSPTTLYSSLKVIENLWQDNRQSENAKEISKQAADLYDKFVGFLNDFEEIGKSIDKSKDSYEKAINKLSSGRGNLISRSQKFLDLGVKPTKLIDNKFIKEEYEL